MDYTIFYKDPLSDKELREHQEWDLFISAYNSNQRVSEIFRSANAKEKHWLIFPEFKYEKNEYPEITDNTINFDMLSEESGHFLIKYLNQIDITKYKANLCIDITGFTRPNLIYFIRLLAELKIKKFDVIYSEPMQYKDNEETTFSELPNKPEPILGCSKVNTNNTKDLLIIASGYDYQLILKVAHEKKACQMKCQIFGFPSLKPDMYQENRLTANNAADSLGESSHYFAPANDPFVTAQTIQEIVKRHSDYTNLYLSPLSTKAQTLGFILYYLYEGMDKNVSIIFPNSEKYSKQTSVGSSTTWKYTIELP